MVVPTPFKLQMLPGRPSIACCAVMCCPFSMGARLAAWNEHNYARVQISQYGGEDM